jgi:hypothetical protein
LLNLGRVYAQRSFEGLTRIKSADTPRAGVVFLAEPGQSMFFNGAEIRTNQIGVAGAGESYISRLSGPTRRGAMTLAKDMDALFMESASGTRRVSGVTVITPPPASLAHLRSLHDYIGRLAETGQAPGPRRDARTRRTHASSGGLDPRDRLLRPVQRWCPTQ